MRALVKERAKVAKKNDISKFFSLFLSKEHENRTFYPSHKEQSTPYCRIKALPPALYNAV